MLGQSNPRSYCATDFDIFLGMDVDKKSIDFTCSDSKGILRSLHIPNNSEHLVRYVRKHFPGQRVIWAYEAGPTGYGLYDGLTAAGFTCLVSPASMIPTAPGQRVKTNRLDSKKITEALRAGQLKSIHVPSSTYRHLRHLTKIRDLVVRQIGGTKCRIKALLLFEGIPFPEAPQKSHHWSRSVIAQLHRLPCSEAVKFRLGRYLEALEFQRQQYLKITRERRNFCRHESELKRCLSYLTSIPGIGQIIAPHLLARIGHWQNLEEHRVHELAAFLGLVPAEHSTGDRVHRGSITRAGDKRLRSKLLQGAWTAIRQDPELREFYRSVYRRHAPQVAARKAIVAVARKLTTRIFAVLKEQRPFVLRSEIHSRPLLPEEIGHRQRLDASQKEEERTFRVSFSRQRLSRGLRPSGAHLSQCDGSKAVPRMAASLSGTKGA
jgi:transposase